MYVSGASYGYAGDFERGGIIFLFRICDVGFRRLFVHYSTFDIINLKNKPPQYRGILRGCKTTKFEINYPLLKNFERAFVHNRWALNP